MHILAIFAIFIVCTLLTLPIAFGMELSTIVMLFAQGDHNAMLTILTKMFTGANSSSFLAIPFFVLAGTLMEHGGISDRILKFASGLVGHLRGGLALVQVLVATLFAAVTGSAVASTTAVGSLMMPTMNKKGYDKGFVAALQACAGTLGPIIPPSINMIVVAAMTGESVANLFMAGIIPGLLIAGFLMVVGYLYARKNQIPLEPRMKAKEVAKAGISSLWALLTPVIILGGIFSGLFTATEAGMIACVYSIIVSGLVYRELTFSKFVAAVKNAAIASAQIIFLIAMANVFAWVLTRMNFGAICTNLIGSLTSNPTLFLLLMVVFFLIIGCFVEITAAITIFVPVLYPIASTYGVGFAFLIIMLLTMAIGQITPPVGVLLSITTEMQGIRIIDTFKYLPSVLLAMLAAVLLCTFFPQIITFLPQLIGTL
ncbi:TRAP transporter large permease [uncultured Flavonifractor sp.]|uniref:TRAP transporter large permease n=1 Tax=uncultured Flavonifractor sp. TaxID=1193534 RepID=UPI0025E7FBF3|nr:TRAP transporter large permease [uncultured Flavonifractor sp.]